MKGYDKKVLIIVKLAFAKSRYISLANVFTPRRNCLLRNEAFVEIAIFVFQCLEIEVYDSISAHCIWSCKSK